MLANSSMSGAGKTPPLPPDTHFAVAARRRRGIVPKAQYLAPGVHPMAIPTRPLGKTGANVSILCLGGWHIGQPAIGDAEAERIMHAAIDDGITFFDNAWDYHEGRSE